jgi:hypothetical protein
MAKRNLSALLDTSITPAPHDEDTAAPARPADHAAAAAVDQAGAAIPPSAVPADAPPAKPATPPSKGTGAVQPRARASGGPRYLELDRKELRIRGDQADDLTVLTRQLNRARKGEGQRITDNTLIRVAIDLLLRDGAKLQGTTEADLLRSALPD